jgi:hypothetical protein
MATSNIKCELSSCNFYSIHLQLAILINFSVEKANDAQLTADGENRVDDEKSNLKAKSSEPHISKSLLESNGFNVIRKIGSGSYSKVKVKFEFYLLAYFVANT